MARRAEENALRQTALEQARSLASGDDDYALACIESVAGNVDAALAWLVKAAGEADFDPQHARQDPDLVWLHDDPRFVAILDATADHPNNKIDKAKHTDVK